MTDVLQLLVNGQALEGWQDVSVQQSINQLTGSFSILAIDKFPGEASSWELSMGSACQINLNGTNVIDGSIDTIPIEYTSSSHSIGVNGRDKTGDLVDCSYYVAGKNEWLNSNALKIIKDIVAPFDIVVEMDDSIEDAVLTKIPKFSSNIGDNSFSLIDKLAKSIGFLPISLGDGKLTLTSAGTEFVHDSLRSGDNIKSGGLTQSNVDRYRTYIVLGQDGGTDFLTQKASTQPKGEYIDEAITRPRQIVIEAETPVNTKQANAQAKWEALTRAGKSRSAKYTVQGWSQSDGSLWEINKLVQVWDSLLSVNEAFLITGLDFNLSLESGSTTEITLMNPAAFTPLASAVGIITSFDEGSSDDLSFLSKLK